MLKRIYLVILIIVLVVGTIALLGQLLFHPREACRWMRTIIDPDTFERIEPGNLSDLKPLEEFTDHFRYWAAPVFHPQGRSLAITGLGSVSYTEFPDETRIWDFETGCARIVGEITKSTEFVEFSAQGDFFVADDCGISGWDGCNALYRYGEDYPIGRYAHATFITFPEGEMLAYSDDQDGKRRLLRLPELSQFVLKDNTPRQSAILFSPDHRFFVSADPQGNATVWDTATESPLYTFASSENASRISDGLAPLVHVLIGPGSRHFALYLGDGEFQVWNAATNHAGRYPVDSNTYWGDCAFIGHSTYLACGHTVWDVKTGSVVWQVRDSYVEVASRDGSLFVTTQGQTVFFWRTADFTSVHALDVGATVRSVRLSPDQKLIAIAKGNRDPLSSELLMTIELWGVVK